MDSQGSGASTISSLLRPRLTLVALITATAAVSISASLGYQYWQQRCADEAADGQGRARGASGSLHRRNAIRRNRRASLLADGSDHSGAAADDDAAASLLAADENAGINNMRPLDAGEGRAETIVDDDGEADERWLDDMTQAVVHRAGQNIVSLLFRVSEDNARRGAYVHRGCACNACGIVPIRGIRYRCANCADFDLCETCESQGLHIKTHIFYKVKVPAPPFGPRQIQPVWYPGDPDSCLRSLPKNLIMRLSRETGFERQELEAFWEQWTYMANTEWREDPDELGLAMDRKTFERCLVPSGGYRHAAPNLIHDRMFAFYDTNNDDLIGFSEFLHGLSYRKRKDKLRKIFNGYDTDRDGLVSRRDFLRFFRAYYVLYKQMHKDILEGLDDQVMASIETHQLINNRQPLSSLFGREGRVPQADLRRMLYGKTINNETGDVSVVDGTGDTAPVMIENRPDIADRDYILSRLLTRSEPRASAVFTMHNSSLTIPNVPADYPRSEPGETTAETNYWDALLDPPETVQDLPALLLGQRDASGLADDIFVPQDDEFNEGDDTLPWSTDAPPTSTEAAAAATTATEGQDAVAAEGQDTAPAQSQDTGAADTQDTAPVEGQDAALSEPVASPVVPLPNTATAEVRSTTGANGTTHVEPEGALPLDSHLQAEQDASSSGQRRVQFNTQRMPTLGQLRAQQEAFLRAHMSKTARVSARRKLHNRWMRRNFYLDEEEGALPPEDWNETEDILAHLNPTEPPDPDTTTTGEPASASSPAAKVRFAEDSTATGASDANEIRSSPSSSVPTVTGEQRWGFSSSGGGGGSGSGSGNAGMDIPEAERDAGREILYQVMQQAFNELLNILFMSKESLAIAAAEAKEDRDQYRPLYEHLSLEELEASATNGAPAAETKPVPEDESPSQVVVDITKPSSDMTLDELLAVSGYAVHDESGAERGQEQDQGGDVPEGAVDTAAAVVDEVNATDAPDANEIELNVADELLAADSAVNNEESAETDATETGGETHTLTALDDVPELSLTPAADIADEEDRRDPTLPQFRPNTEAELAAMVQAQAQSQALAAASATATVATSSAGPSSPGVSSPQEKEAQEPSVVEEAKPAAEETSRTIGQDNSDSSHERKAKHAQPKRVVTRAMMADWKRLDLAEEEARARGGWGKLSYEEFERIFKEEEAMSNRLDYLGSWIDFCIP